MTDARYGPYVQITQRLRLIRRDAPHTERESERPRQGQRGDWGDFLDDPDAAAGATPGPTLVTFKADELVDIDMLLRAGAIREPRADQLPVASSELRTESVRNKPKSKEAASGAPSSP